MRIGHPANQLPDLPVFSRRAGTWWGGKFSTGTFKDWGEHWNPQTDEYAYLVSPSWFGPRYWHTAVWTGTEMIVWGGGGPGVHYNDGIRYDRAAETLSAVSSTGAPSARFGHTAVWTGTEMIVWGGSYGSYNFFSDGARYDPVSDTWKPLPSLNAPSGRYMHTAVWTGTEMIVWGGRNGSEVFGDGASYSPSTDTWTPLPASNAPAARFGHTAIWTGTEMIVWGGADISYTPYLDGGRYKLLADYQVTGMSNPPEQLAPGQAFAVTYAIKNFGPGLSGRSNLASLLKRPIFRIDEMACHRSAGKMGGKWGRNPISCSG